MMASRTPDQSRRRCGAGQRGVRRPHWINSTPAVQRQGRRASPRADDRKAVPALLAGDKRKVFDLMMEDKAALARARIPVERINGPVFFLRHAGRTVGLKRNVRSDDGHAEAGQLPHAHEHVAIEGGMAR